METERFHDLLSVIWKLREAGGGVQSESKGVRTEGRRPVSQLSQEERVNPPFSTFLFFSSLQQIG